MHIPAVVGMFAHASRYVVRRETLAKWLVHDVSKTANASALAMLYSFTRRIMPPNSNETPKDVFERILCKVGDICPVTNTEGGRKQARRGRAKKNRRGNQDSDQPRKAKVANLKKAHREL
jgi:hypothetical protein